jgi:hypothetical protein
MLDVVAKALDWIDRDPARAALVLLALFAALFAIVIPLCSLARNV